jgi:Gpi18-like mannosyltransferase
MSERAAPSSAAGVAAEGRAFARSGARPWLAATWRTWRPAVVTGVVSVAAFKVVTELAALVAVFGAAFPREVLHHPSLLYSVWNKWDVGWYLSLAQDGYARWEHVLIPPGHYQDGVAFAPGLPIAVRVAYRALHLNPMLAGILVVTACLLVAVIGFYRLVEMDFGGRVAGTAVLLLLVFPGAMFFSTVYAESLVLMGTVWAVLMVRQDRLALAGLFAAVAVLSKVAAVIILVLMLLEYRRTHPVELLARWWRLGWLGTPIVALAGWSAYLQYRFQNPLAFLTSHQQWDHHLSAPWVPVAKSIGELVSLTMFDQPHGVISLLDLCSVPLIAAAGVYLLLRVNRGYGVYTLVALLAVTTAGLLDSTYRHLLLAFPVFIAGAVLSQRRPWLERGLLVASAPLLVYTVGRFVSGQWAG